MRFHTFVGGAMLSLLLVSCGGDDGFSSSEAGDDVAAPAMAQTNEDAAQESGIRATATAVDDSAAAGRLIARTGYVNVLVEDLAQSMADASAIGAANGGFIASEQTSRDSSELTFKVAGGAFDEALAAFGELGEVDSQWVTTEDRTAQIVDLQARLDTAEASLARTRELFEAADGVDQLVTAENEIARREETVEVLRAQLRSQQESVSLATITVYLTIDPDSLPDEPVTIDGDLPTIRRAFSNGVAVMLFGLRLVAITLAWLVPWIPIIALVVYLWRRATTWLAKRPTRPGRQLPQPTPGQTPPTSATQPTTMDPPPPGPAGPAPTEPAAASAESTAVQTEPEPEPPSADTGDR